MFRYWYRIYGRYEVDITALAVARALIRSQKYSHEQIMHLLYFLKNFIYIENPDINRNKENAMGIIETIKKIAREEALEEGAEKKPMSLLRTFCSTLKEQNLNVRFPFTS